MSPPPSRIVTLRTSRVGPRYLLGDLEAQLLDVPPRAGVDVGDREGKGHPAHRQDGSGIRLRSRLPTTDDREKEREQ
jgi:hypothetical protein